MTLPTSLPRITLSPVILARPMCRHCDPGKGYVIRNRHDIRAWKCVICSRMFD